MGKSRLLGAGGENVTAETNTQIEIIGEIATKFNITIDEAAGTNKNKLRINNTNLQKIIENTSSSITETNFLWAWKKKERQEVTQNVNVTFNISAPSSASPTYFNVTGSSDINLLVTSDFYGISLYGQTDEPRDHYMTLGSDGKAHFYIWGMAGYQDWTEYLSPTWSWNASTKQITISGTPGGTWSTPLKTASSITKTKSKKTTTEVQIGVVTDENQNAYPHNTFAEDGYYYVRTGPNTTESFKYFEYIIEGNKAALLAIGSTGSNIYGNYKTGTDWGSFTKLT